MHEFGVTEAIIKGLLDQLAREHVSNVLRVHFRRSSAFSEDVLRQTFAMLSADTPLESAELVVQVSVLNVTCEKCGYDGEVNSDDLVGHMFICPRCGTIREIAEAHDLELIGVIGVIAQTEHSLDLNMSERRRILIQGAVQGVGFRPFIYRLAAELEIRGWVSNSSQGVIIEAEAPAPQLDTFLAQIEAQKPPHSFIQRITVETIPSNGDTAFAIRESSAESSHSAIILPDLATCPDCLREIFDPTNRRFRYPFTNCTHCGPRYTIIERLPYDRPNTTMRTFAMCDECRAEYENPLDRRFHAQPNACPRCGPQLKLWNAAGKTITDQAEALLEAVVAIRQGAILALKGMGGFQLLVDARNSEAIRWLRARKHRPDKPFALMIPIVQPPLPPDELLWADALLPFYLWGKEPGDEGQTLHDPLTRRVMDFCEVSDLESELLRSSEAPIVLLRQKDGHSLSADIAPENPNLGVMLPYTPLHHLLMAALDFPIVATSGNLSGEPLCTDEYEALTRLKGIADYFLIHNRPIVRPVDDFVVRIMAKTSVMLRRARGYAPLPIELPDDMPPMIAVGAHLKNTVAVSIGQQVFVSQHIGDLETPELISTFKHILRDLGGLYEQPPTAVACDLHPDYRSTQLAQELAEQYGIPQIPIQHHYAHILACMAEHRLTAPVLGIAWDGTGYGTDGTIWGGEFLHITERSFDRCAYLRPFRLPGGDQAIREPRRAAMGLLFELYGENLPNLSALGFSTTELSVLKSALARGLNAPLTSSMGRFFDAVAALIGLRGRTTFEGQAAMDLEFACEGISTDRWYPFSVTPVTIAGGHIGSMIDWKPVIEDILKDLAVGQTMGEIAAAFHNTLVEMLMRIANSLTTEYHTKDVVLSGGCFQNKRLLEMSVRRLRKAGLQPYWSQKIPPNDGGIALGQIAGAWREHHPKDTRGA